MPNLTTKELSALSDQLDFERVLHCKYLSAAQDSQDQELKTKFQACIWKTTTPCWAICADKRRHKHERPGENDRFYLQREEDVRQLRHLCL